MKDIKNKKILVIVESPQKCKHISKFLKDAGYKKAIVLASVGHISNLHDNRNSYKNTGIYPAEDFRLNIMLTDDKKDVVKTLSETAKNVDYVYIMTDGDREGEAIAWSLIKFLKLKKDAYFRCITHEITPKAVISAIENPVGMNEALVDAAHARMAVDKMLGYALSPTAKAYIGAKSVGRCQSAALKLICDREKEIQNFIPETYFDLYLNFEKNKTMFKAKYVGTDIKKVDHLSTQVDVNVVKFKCDKDYIIKNITKKEKSESPKPPFTTATFQQEASSKVGLKVKDAMSIAQSLFENGFISYHRTDSTDIAEEFLPTLEQYIENTFGKNMFTAPRIGKKTENTQNGHECLRILNPELSPEEFNKLEKPALHKKVYEIIWNRTIAACLPNAKISETIYNIYNNDQKFILTSNEIVDAGYKVLYDSENQENEQLVKETFSINEILQNCKLEEIKKQTLPPARFSEASLVKELQTRGIGRPSTFASIVETITSPYRGYSTIEDKKIVPTELGIQLSSFLDRAFPNIINLNYTKDMETELDLIANKQLSKLEFLNAFFSDLETALENNTESCQKPCGDKVCPNCGAPMVIRRSRFGKLFYGCSRYPECSGIISIK